MNEHHPPNFPCEMCKNFVPGDDKELRPNTCKDSYQDAIPGKCPDIGYWWVKKDYPHVPCQIHDKPT